MSPANVRAITPRFSEALVAAASLHADQGRKGTDTPYIAHLLGVTSIALEYGADEDQAIAALLHDSIEDAPAEFQAEGVRRLIASKFGHKVLEIVEGCTDSDTVPKPPWRQRKQDYINRLAHEGIATFLVSAADKLYNVRSILSDFRTSGDQVFDRFNRDAGKVGTIGYYRGLVSAFEARLDALPPSDVGRFPALLRELDATVTMLEIEAGLTGVWPPER